LAEVVIETTTSLTGMTAEATTMLTATSVEGTLILEMSSCAATKSTLQRLSVSPKSTEAIRVS
jgi:hypothetical protein